MRWLICLAMILSLSPGAHASALSQRPTSQSAPISRAVGVYVTERGQQYLKSNLLDLIGRMGYEIGNGGFEGWDYQASEPFDPDQLPVHMRPFAGTIGQLRESIQHWFFNAGLGNPMIRLQIPNISYSTGSDLPNQTPHLGLEADAQATARLMGDHGVVMLLKAELPALRVESDNIDAFDSDNSFLGHFGINRPWLRLAQKSVPLEITLPISFQLDGRGGLSFEMLGLQSNLGDVDFELGYAPPLHLPVVKIRVNGHSMTVHQEQFEKELQELKPALLKTAQAYLANYAAQNMATTVNAWTTGKYSNLLFSDVNQMDPPGAPATAAPAIRYQWGVSPEEIHLTRDYLMLGMSGWIDDPLSKHPGGAVSRIQVTRPPSLSALSPSSYDAAMVISEDLVNRVLGLGFERGYYPTLDVSGSRPLEMLQAPEFHFTNASNSQHGKLHLRVRHHVQGFEESIAIHQEVTFELDVNARLVHTRDGKLSVVVDSVDPASLKVDQSTVAKIFRKIVRKKIIGDLLGTNLTLAKTPKVIVDSLPVPSQILGVPLKIKDFRADANGYLVLYLEYDFGR